MIHKTKKSITIKLLRSPIGCKKSHRDTIKGLGLRKINSVSVLENTPSVQGMINKINYLVKEVVHRET